MRHIVWFFAACAVFAVGSFSFSAHAAEFTSTNFRVRDPVLHMASSTRMTSQNFRLTGAVGQIAVGTSSSGTFRASSGFLYFPVATKPTLSATAGDAKASLSWTSSKGFLGWVVSGYNIGQSTSAGGPYTYTSVGNVLSAARSSLSNGTTYYFVVRPEDAFGNSIATSSEVSATPVAGASAAAVGQGGVLETLLKAFGVKAGVFVSGCASDLNCDGVVNPQDLSIFFSLAKDHSISARDLSIFLSRWQSYSPIFVPPARTARGPTIRERAGRSLLQRGADSKEEAFAGRIESEKIARGTRRVGEFLRDIFSRLIFWARNVRSVIFGEK